jgi:hypothetical protein
LTNEVPAMQPSSTPSPAAAGGTTPAVPGSCCQDGGSAGRERVRFFARQLLTPDDLTQEQQYFRAKLRRHNRLLHGWGVVCGCEVKPTGQPSTVTIEPGYVLAPDGEEIVIDQGVTIDLSRRGVDGNAAVTSTPDMDPWCAGVRLDLTAGATIYLALAYAECPARPVRVQSAGCSCDGGSCEYSRVRDGFVVRALTQLPASYADMTRPGPPFACPATGVRPCPSCVADPWVILAAIKPGGTTVAASDIDNYTYRRYVASFGGWWFTCPGPTPSPPPSPTPTPTPTPPTLLRVSGVRLLHVDPASPTTNQPTVFFDSATAKLTQPLVVDLRNSPVPLNAIEVQFAQAALNYDSVVDGKTFVVKTAATAPLLTGTVVRMPNNVVRWVPRATLPNLDVIVTVVGDGSPAVTSDQGLQLDGEPRGSATEIGFPSGDGKPGGNFQFTFRIFTVG